MACLYLNKHGFLIKERNYLRKFGEIDIIATKDGLVHFFEVKSVIDRGFNNGHRPEENVHNLKLNKLRKVIQIYLNDNKYGLDAKFKFHVITVRIEEGTKKSYIKMLENVIL